MKYSVSANVYREGLESVSPEYWRQTNQENWTLIIGHKAEELERDNVEAASDGLDWQAKVPSLYKRNFGDRVSFGGHIFLVNRSQSSVSMICVCVCV